MDIDTLLKTLGDVQSSTAESYHLSVVSYGVKGEESEGFLVIATEIPSNRFFGFLGFGVQNRPDIYGVPHPFASADEAIRTIRHYAFRYERYLRHIAHPSKFEVLCEPLFNQRSRRAITWEECYVRPWDHGSPQEWYVDVYRGARDDSRKLGIGDKQEHLTGEGELSRNVYTFSSFGKAAVAAFRYAESAGLELWLTPGYEAGPFVFCMMGFDHTWMNAAYAREAIAEAKQG